MNSDGDIKNGSERKRGSGVKIIYDQLRDEILSLILPPGSPIDEAQLAERFNVSRTPIREALVRLESDGLIDTLPNRSTMVSNIDFLNIHTFFDALMLMYRVTTRLAAENHRATDLPPIRALQKRFADAVEAHDALAIISTNVDFHMAIAEAGRSPYFIAFFRRLLDDGRRILRLYYQTYDDVLPKEFVDEHDGMIAAIEKRDVEACDRLATAHVQEIISRIQKLFLRGSNLNISL